MRILVSTDGSEFSRAAVEKCCGIIVEPEKAAIKIVSVFEIIDSIDISISPEFSQELEQSARAQAEEFAAQAAAQIRECFPDSNIDLTVQVSSGAPDRILIETAHEWKADLIVIGSHGRGFWGRMLLGSITDELVHHAPCSVLVVRKTDGENA
ncbi:MAG: universal stress protein [Pyrinomonadaceae bacterium]